ncbi:MAG: hypothetical protein EAX96_14690 [Candidatus Lokiarchaeota archaeon]|nr:hypothetical protein [Candidatus Lokiarchaeota archaeon]
MKMKSKNKKIFLSLGISAILIISIILIIILIPRPQNPPSVDTSNLWIWVSGNYSQNNNGTYGTKGVASEANIPGARYGSAAWIDDTGNFWLFGGSGYDNVSGANGRLNDLWKFDGANWTWVSGNYSIDNYGTYGTKGVASEANIPGARLASCSWIDDTSNFWLFGGYGYDNSSGAVGFLNDLWKFDGVNWTWVSGNYSCNNNGMYGTKGIANETNVPGSRYGSSFWTDNTGNFWLFGGYGNGNGSSSKTFGYLNDLWKFDGANWTWVSGNYSQNNNGTYGTKGVADEMNILGARAYSCPLTDTTGNFWLFGGYGYGNVSQTKDYLNDLWKYSP